MTTRVYGYRRYPDLVHAGLAFVDDVDRTASPDNIKFHLSIAEPWSCRIGVAVAIKLHLSERLLQHGTTHLDYLTTTAGTRGADIETLFAISLQLNSDLPALIGDLVADAGEGLRLQLPSWYVEYLARILLHVIFLSLLRICPCLLRR